MTSKDAFDRGLRNAAAGGEAGETHSQSLAAACQVFDRDGLLKDHINSIVYDTKIVQKHIVNNTISWTVVL